MIFRRLKTILPILLSAWRVKKSAPGDERARAQRALAGLFADARGVTMKVGQVFAGVDAASPFAPLVESVAPLPLSSLRPHLARALGAPVENVFRAIEESRAAASLGQVHKAVLRDGRAVAVKIRYPGIAAAVEAELRLAGMLPGLGPVRQWGFDIGSYKQTLKDNMDRELDYRLEAARQKRFRDSVRVPGLRVAEVMDDLCREDVLVQSWEEGVFLDKALTWPEPMRLEIARIHLATLFSSLFRAGLVHADPHRGNSFYRRNGAGGCEVVLLDFGSLIEIDEPARLALLKLILATGGEGDANPLECFAAMGFDAAKLAPIAPSLPALCRILFAPFLAEGFFTAEDWQLSKRFESLLGEKRWWFRSSAPAKILFLMRAFHGLVEKLEALRADFPWGPVLRETLPPDLIARARAFCPPALPAGLVARAQSIRAAARTLEVRVAKPGGGVSVSLPAEAVLDLENLIPEDVRAELTRTGMVDLAAILVRVKESGIAPQLLFEQQIPAREGKEARTYRVWLQ